jgi:hypothetical protein
MRSPYLESVRAEGAADVLVQLLDARFPGQLPADVRVTIQKTRDRSRLRQWVKLAATATSLDEFRCAGEI